MYTLKGVFPEPKKEQKKNFIKENMKQLKHIQETKTSRESKPGHKGPGPIFTVNSSPSSNSNKITYLAKPPSSRKKTDIRIKKGDMSEFLKRKEFLKLQQQQANERDYDDDDKSEESGGPFKEIGCQTVETNLAQKFEDSTKLTMLYPKKEDALQASGDSGGRRSPTMRASHTPQLGDAGENERQPYARLHSIIEKKTDKNADPYLPAGYQKGVLPKYLRARKDAVREEPVNDITCPLGHVALPDAERKETLKMLRNSFAELVSELNKMPVKTDTLRMRNRKVELEKQLAKLEEGIKVFSRPKVFVKIGE